MAGGNLRRNSLLVLSLLFFCQELCAQFGTWRQLAVPGAPGARYSFIDFADSVNGWLLSVNGKYTMTSDGGKSWYPARQIPDSSEVVKMKLYDYQTGVLVSQINWGPPVVGKLIYTTDQGLTWNKSVLPDSTYSIRSTSLVNRALIGFVSDKNVLFKSSDLGTSWDTLSLPRSFFPLDTEVGILEKGKIVIGGGAGLANLGFLFVSADSGKTWKPFGEQSFLASVWGHFINTELCYFWMGYDNYAIQYTNTVLYNATTDATVQYGNSTAIGALYDDGTIFAFSANSAMVKASTDPADSTYYIQDFAGSGPRVTQISTVAQKYAWILDDSGRAFQRIDLLTSVGEQKAMPARTHLSQNYPNPFNPATAIRYELSTSGRVTLKIFDLLGREVAILVDGDKSPGNYTINWDASALSTGVYFCRLEVHSLVNSSKASFVQTRKMLVLK